MMMITDLQKSYTMDAWESESGQVYVFKLWGMVSLPRLQSTSEDDVAC